MPTITSKVYNLYGAFQHKANLIKEEVCSLIPEAHRNYGEAEKTYQNWDFPVANSLKPEASFDYINNVLRKDEESYRQRAELLLHWLDNLPWVYKTNSEGESYKSYAVVSFKQYNWLAEQQLDHEKILRIYCDYCNSKQPNKKYKKDWRILK